MAAGVTRLSDLIVPEIFHPYTMVRTTELSEILNSGAVITDERLTANLAGAGLTFHEPFFKDLDNDEENISNDDPADLSTPNKIGTGQEVQVRLSRNNSWSSMDLASDLNGMDPMQAIVNRVGDYWTRRLQLAFIATMRGVFANSDAATDANHVQGDLTYNVSGAAFAAGVTNFTTENFIDAVLGMGDAQAGLGMVLVHSVVYGRMQKNNLIDFVPDSVNMNAAMVPTFLGRRVVQDDGMPNSNGVFETWIFGAGAVGIGRGAPKTPVEVDRVAAAGNGSGQDVLHSRVEWMIHPVGYAFAVTPPPGGPSNATTAGNLGHAASWRRAFWQRKQIKIARLITREF